MMMMMMMMTANKIVCFYAFSFYLSLLFLLSNNFVRSFITLSRISDDALYKSTYFNVDCDLEVADLWDVGLGLHDEQQMTEHNAFRHASPLTKTSRRIRPRAASGQKQ